MRRTVTTVAILAFVGVALASPAGADAVYHSEHIGLTPVGDAALHTGFVENIHANGPTVFALERYVLVGATPRTQFDVALNLWVGDPTCSGLPMASLPTASFWTNGVGNGVGMVALPPSAAEGLHGATLGIVWTISTGQEVAYRTACTEVVLD